VSDTAPNTAPDLDDLSSVWPAIVERIREDSPLLAALLNDCRPESLLDQTVVLTWPESAAFLKRKAEDATNNEIIAKGIDAIIGKRLRIRYELRPDSEERSASPLSEEELIARLMSDFDAKEISPEPQETPA
jgi:DNA polymerase-3 subunit gamma/tau